MENNMKIKILLTTIMAMASTSIIVTAQEPLNYWRYPDAMIQDQAVLLFAQAHKILHRYPPSTVANDERKLALFSIDALLHDTRLDNGSAFIDYINKQYLHVADMLRNEKPNVGETHIYKLYNHGFVIQTPSITFGMDIIRGGSAINPFVRDSVIRKVVEQCDTLFVSHQHADHADKSVIQLFAERQTPMGKAITVHVLPGHQDNMPNNMYVVTTPEGVTVMHTGDQYNSDDMAWIKHIGDSINVDILLMHSWMPETEKSVEGIRPGLIIVGHENEMGHTIDHRESFWLTFRRFKNVATPYVVMAWGERYTFFH